MHIGKSGFNGGQPKLSQHRQVIEPRRSAETVDNGYRAIEVIKCLLWITTGVQHSLLYQLLMRPWWSYPVNVSFNRGAGMREAFVFPVIPKSARRILSS